VSRLRRSGPVHAHRGRWALRVLAATALGVFTAATDAAGQERPAPPPATATPKRPPISVSPGGAFLRAIIVPGWGHTATGSYTRAGFYFGAQTATVYTLLRTRMRVGEAQSRIRFRESVIRAQLTGAGITDPTVIEESFDEDEDLTELRDLLDSRQGQQEDLVAFGLFVLLISGADAYVSAHLARFPEPLELEARPIGNGRMEVGLRWSLPN
jgi:uncharacterized protein DUF5683